MMQPLAFTLALWGTAWASETVVTDRHDLVRVDAERLEAHGGEEDCLVRFQHQQGQATGSAAVHDCPDDLLPEVEEAAAAWRFSRDAPSGHMWSYVMVRGPEPPPPELPVVQGLKGRRRVVPDTDDAIRAALPAGAMSGVSAGWNIRCEMDQTLDQAGAVVSYDLERCPIVLRPKVAEVVGDWLWEPPTQDGQPIAAVTSFAYLFVPAERAPVSRLLTPRPPNPTARHAHGDWEVDPAQPVTWLPAEQLQAYGGEVDCLVHLEQGAHQHAAEPTIVRCPDDLAGPVLEAARQWEVTVDEGQVEVLAVVMARSEKAAATVGADLPDEGAPQQVEWTEVRAVERQAPQYPAAAKALSREHAPAHLAARCRVRLFIDEQGVPYDTDLEQCPQIFRDAADEAARQWRFSPMSVDGQPVKATFQLTFKFVLQ